MPSDSPALVAPNKRLSPGELVDIKFQSLGNRQVLHVKVYVVNEVVERRNQGVAAVMNALRREISDDVIVPQDIGEGLCSSDMMLSRIATERGR